jgi:hypothetical protein
MKIKYYIYILEKYLTMPKKGNVRHKGKLITIRDYKALMKQKAKKESKPKPKKKST